MIKAERMPCQFLLIPNNAPCIYHLATEISELLPLPWGEAILDGSLCTSRENN